MEKELHTNCLVRQPLSEKKFYSNFDNTTKKTYTTTDKNAKAYLKTIGKNVNVTKSNAYKLLNEVKNYSLAEGYTSKYEHNPTTGAYTNHFFIYSPAAYHASKIQDKFKTYFSERNPFSTWSSKHFEIKSINGQGKTINATLKSTVTDEMILGANYEFSWDSEIEKSKTYTFPIIVQNTSNNRKYYAIASVKSGSNKMTIKLQNHKLVKGKTYKLLSQATISGAHLGNWLSDYAYATKENINSFKAK